MPNVMVALRNILLNAAKFVWRPLLECRAVTLSILENATFGRIVNFAPGKIPLGGNSPENVYIVYQRRRRINIVQSLVERRRCNITKPKRETGWHLLGCPKPANRSQPVVGRSLPYLSGPLEEILLFSNFSRLSIHALLRRYSPTKLCDGAQMAIFCVIFASCIFSDTRSKLALRPHHVFKYGRHPLWDRWE